MSRLTALITTFSFFVFCGLSASHANLENNFFGSCVHSIAAQVKHVSRTMAPHKGKILTVLALGSAATCYGYTQELSEIGMSGEENLSQTLCPSIINLAHVCYQQVNENGMAYCAKAAFENVGFALHDAKGLLDMIYQNLCPNVDSGVTAMIDSINELAKHQLMLTHSLIQEGTEVCTYFKVVGNATHTVLDAVSLTLPNYFHVNLTRPVGL